MSQCRRSEDSQLIADLIALSKNSPKLVKSSVYPAPSDPNLLVTSWKMNEFKYYDVPSPFPTYSRGLFTLELQPARSYRIVARGYDKFFNIGEVPWTEVMSLAALSFSSSHRHPIVVLSRVSYVLSLRSLPQIKWLHHLHCCAYAVQAYCHFKAFYWAYRKSPKKPRRSRRIVVEALY
jgi:hypothetical protein